MEDGNRKVRLARRVIARVIAGSAVLAVAVFAVGGFAAAGGVGSGPGGGDVGVTDVVAPGYKAVSAQTIAEPAAVFADDEGLPATEPGVVLVQPAEGVTAQQLSQAISALDVVASPVVSADDISLGVVEIPLVEGADERAARESIAALPEVTASQPNYRYYLSDDGDDASMANALAGKAASSDAYVIGVNDTDAENRSSAYESHTSDPLEMLQWSLGAVHAYDAWDLLDRLGVDQQVTVAVFDSGCITDHEDFQGAIVDPYDATGIFGEDESALISTAAANGAVHIGGPFTDIDGHGTHVAGIIAAREDNGIGGAGIGHNLLRVMPVEVCYPTFTEDGTYNKSYADTYTLVKAYNHVLQNAAKYNIRVVNMSLGRLASTLAEEDVMVESLAEKASAQGIFSVGAAGNNNSTSQYLPADLLHSGFSVIALDQDNLRARYSNYNAKGKQTRQISAPGSQIVSTYGNCWGTANEYTQMSGTSMASPLVAGVVGLMFAAQPHASTAQVKEAVIAGAIDLYTAGFDMQSGYGEVNAAHALCNLLSVPYSDGRINFQRSIENATITGLVDKVYAGQALTQSLVVKLDGTTLREGDDFVLTYGDNVNVGTAHVTIRGIGAYVGEIEKSFAIVPAQIATATIEEVPAQVYTGGACTPDPVLFFNGTRLVSGSDYDVVGYVDNVDIGTATVTLRGIGNFTGSVSLQFVVRGSMSAASIAPIADATYTGAAIMPAPVVTIGGKALRRNIDYRLSYEGNVNAGEATVVIDGMGAYGDSTRVSFTIYPRSIASATVTGIVSKVFTGEPLVQSPVVRLGGVPLVADRDYRLSYAGNLEVGTATMAVEGMGNYTGSVLKAFTITHKGASTVKLAASNVTGYVASFDYDGTPKTQPGLKVKVGSKQLVEGSDYEVAYFDNVDPGTAYVVVAGVGLYSGSVMKAYKIKAPSIVGAKVSGLRDYEFDGREKRPTPVVSIGSKQLVENRDYSVSYTNNVNPGIATVTITGKGAYTGSVSATFAIGFELDGAIELVGLRDMTYTGKALAPVSAVAVQGKALRKGIDYAIAYKNNVNAGTATVVVTGKGSCTGTVTRTFEIAKADNKMVVRTVTKSLRAASLRSASGTVTGAVTASSAIGTVSYSKVSGSSQLAVDAQTGKIAVARGTAIGRYTAQVAVTAAGAANYKAKTQTVTVTVLVV